MDQVVRRKMAAVFTGGLLAAFFVAAPVRADDDTSYFGQPAPKHFLLNKLMNPQTGQGGESNGQAASATASGQAAGANGQTAAGKGQGGNGQVAAGQATEEDEDGPGPYPKRYLLNKLFDGNK